MFRKILTMITALAMATAMFTGCVAKPETEQAPTAETTVQPEETTTTEVPRIRVREQANKIVSDFMNELKTNVQNVDYTAFEAMYDRSNPAITDEVIKNDWDFFNQHFTGEKIFDIDCEATAFDDNQIFFDTFLHWGTSNASNNSWSFNTKEILNIHIIYDEASDKWLWSATEQIDEHIQKQFDDYMINAFGEEAYRNGFVTSDYEVRHNKALIEGVECYVKSVIVNDDGSVDLTISIVNGLDFSQNISYRNGYVSLGGKKVIDFEDKYYVWLWGDVGAKTIKNVKLHIPAEDLIETVEKSDLTSYYISLY
ncbi:MAG: hypothetical protein J6J52_05775 [Oscillospiraceae bacterium]|nr:hypothetical protein [Oscillospiraceae bacterium]